MADSEAVVKFCEKLKNLVKTENVTLDQIYKCDETYLNFKTLPCKAILTLDNEGLHPGEELQCDAIRALFLLPKYYQYDSAYGSRRTRVQEPSVTIYD